MRKTVKFTGEIILQVEEQKGEYVELTAYERLLTAGSTSGLSFYIEECAVIHPAPEEGEPQKDMDRICLDYLDKHKVMTCGG